MDREKKEKCDMNQMNDGALRSGVYTTTLSSSTFCARGKSVYLLI